MGTQALIDLRWGLSALEGLWRASWQGALWAVLVWALTRAVPRMPAALRAGLWWLVSLKFVLSLGVLSPVMIPLLPAEPRASVEQAVPSEPGPVTGVVLASTHPVVPSERAVPWREVAIVALLAAWGLGVAWQLRGHLRAWASMRRLRRRARPVSAPELEEILHELALEAGLRRVPRLRVSREVTSPLATGLLSPVVVLPARALQRLDAEALRMALAHELAHFQRRDLWLGWVPAIAEMVLFFHPLMRKAAREYALAREEACDAEALRLTGAEPGDYGQLLLAFGVSRSHGTAAALGASAHLHALHRRLTMLEHVDVSIPRGRAPMRAALMVLGLAVLVPFQVVAREPAPAPPAPPAAPKVAEASVVPAVPAAPVAKVAPAVPAPPPPAAPRPLPVVAPVPRVAPAAPVPPVAPMLALADRDEDDDADEDDHDDGVEGYVLVSGDTVMMAGSTSDLRRAKALDIGGKGVLVVRRSGKSYVIRDAKLLEQARAAFEPQTKMGDQQKELGKKQSELGLKQSELGQKQAALGMKQAALGQKQADLAVKLSKAAMGANDAERDRLEKELEKSQQDIEKEMDALGDQQEELGKQQDVLGAQQDKLGQEEDKLGEQMEKQAREGEQKLKSLIDDAVSKGLAQPVDS